MTATRSATHELAAFVLTNDIDHDLGAVTELLAHELSARRDLVARRGTRSTCSPLAAPTFDLMPPPGST